MKFGSREFMGAAFECAMHHYDGFRTAGALEIDARHAAELYLRRKCPGMLDANGAAVALADALARRAAARIDVAEIAIINGVES